jgi:hypothetical protein
MFQTTNQWFYTHQWKAISLWFFHPHFAVKNPGVELQRFRICRS